MIKFFLIFLTTLLPLLPLNAKLPNLEPPIVVEKVNEIMKSHVTHKELTPLVIQRTLENFLDQLDPTKSYFIETEINQWVNPTPEQLEEILKEYKENNFSTFYEIHKTMLGAIERRHELETQIDLDELPKNVSAKEFKDLEWAHDKNELLNRLTRIKALQIETTIKMKEELRELAEQRLKKYRLNQESELQNNDPVHVKNLVLTKVLKSTASALDTHTSYFTPEEASQFMIDVQQRLFGIGAQLRDDINGLTVVRIIEGGPASLSKKLRVNDRIIAVNGEPIVGMAIVDAVDLIRGKEDTEVLLTIMRNKADEEKDEEKLEITLTRGEVVLKEARYDVSHEPFGDGVIAHLKLHTFYQDPENSSTKDLKREFEDLKKEHNIKGVILDLRYNSGGLLTEAVGVTGLFITKGIVVSIMDHNGNVQHLRDIDGKTMWDGPLVVLVNKASASAAEIVAAALQDYGRGIIVGDDHTFGKGTFQILTVSTQDTDKINPIGEYKVTRGRYYTVSGKSPQMTGVPADIVVPGLLSEMDFGEQFAKYPLDNDHINENFDDDLADIPFFQRQKIRPLYLYNLQKKNDTYTKHIATLKKNSDYRIENNRNYQTFLKELKKFGTSESEQEDDQFGKNDLQMIEADNIIKDLVLITSIKEASAEK
ncbi:MAG: S41 family peptidase [Waddliaceae bacterium]